MVTCITCLRFILGLTNSRLQRIVTELTCVDLLRHHATIKMPMSVWYKMAKKLQ